MTDSEFIMEQQRALERMLEMSKKSKLPQNAPHSMPPAPEFVKISGEKKSDAKETAPPKAKKRSDEVHRTDKGFDLSGILSSLGISGDIGGDTSLILILLLVLWSDKSDKLLLLALAYILL